MLTVLEDAGEPAHVRNDYRRAYMATAGPSPFDRGSPFERFVAETYGRMGLPAAVTPKQRPTLMAFITAADGQGLADRTQRRFFSDGSLPDDAVVDRGTTPAEVMVDARGSLPYAYPRAAAARAQGDGAAALRVHARQAAPARVRARAGPRALLPRQAVYADTARALLPEIAGYGAGLINHLFRAEIHIDTASAGAALVSVVGARGRRPEGRGPHLRRGRGRRAQVPRDRATGAAGVRVTVPAGTKKLAAVLRGEDDAGDLVAVGESAIR